MTSDLQLAVVGSVGLDTIETPLERRTEVLGGSASFACAAAALFTRVGMVGVVGDDFPEPHRVLLGGMGIDLAGLQVMTGRTFRWSGVYETNMDNRRTLSTELNVFAEFSPELPPAYRTAPYLFLANIGPGLQLHVLDQVDAPRFVVADTMDLWIETARDELAEVIARVDLLTLNESEARHYTGEHNLIRAARRLQSDGGPAYVLVKKGEHGAMLFTPGDVFVLPAYPVDSLTDPTGAGDSFAGGLMGALAAAGEVTDDALRKALSYANVVASFGVEAFSLDRLGRLTRAEVEARRTAFLEMTRIPG